jgi:pyruvate dehydrogenase kinase 2/3/4
LAHRVQELDDLPDGLNEMPSVNKVKDWYAQSFEVGSFVRLSQVHVATDLLTCSVPHIRKSHSYLGPIFRKTYALAS